MEYNLADLFESVADAVPERIGLVVGERRLSFAELDERANRIAHALIEAGIGKGDHVGLYLGNCSEYVETMLGCFKIRAVPVNVNFRYVEDELLYLLDNADIACLLYHRGFESRVSAVFPKAPKIRQLVRVNDETDGPSGSAPVTEALDYERSLAHASPAHDFGPRSGDDLFLLYTGGTTGMPKGVMWRQEDLFFAGLMGANPYGPAPEGPEQVALRAAARAQTPMMSAAPLIHGAAQLGTFIALLQGSRAVLQRRFDAAGLLQIVSREQVFSLSIVGDAMARPLADALRVPGRPDVSCLKILSSAGAVFSDAVKGQLRESLGEIALIDAFGSSETGSQGMNGTPTEDGGLRFSMNENTRVIDEQLRVVEPGSGRLGCVAQCGHVPQGYYKDPEKTAKTFPVVDGVRYVMLGDVARHDADGSVVVFGRGSFCINTGGEKVYPDEVERALKHHPDVFDALVVGIPDERWGERIAAVIQPVEGGRPTLEELDRHCRARVAGYKVPRQIHLVERVMRLPSGKPDYPWAREIAIAEAGQGA